MKKPEITASKTPFWLRPGAAIFDLLAAVLTTAYRIVNKPGARMIRSKNQFTRAFGAAWLAFFGALLPLFLFRAAAGAVLMHDALYAWRK